MTEWQLPQGYLSPHQVNRYLSCGKCYELRYVVPPEKRIPTPEKAVLWIGACCHESLEAVRRRWVGLPPGIQAEAAGYVPVALQEAQDVCSTSWDGRFARARAAEAEVGPPDLGSHPSYRNWGEAKDYTLKLVQFAVPLLARNDLEAGILAVEKRAWGLGAPLDDEEAAMEYQPIFPFPFKAVVDVVYQDGSSKDFKTAAQARPPAWSVILQQMLYGAPWHFNDQPLRLGIDQLVKHKHLRAESFRTFWMEPTEDQYVKAVTRVLQAAEGISAGRFEENPSELCDYDHGWPSYRLATFDQAA